jgi:transcriptional regulator with XRE-family HTH domain
MNKNGLTNDQIGILEESALAMAQATISNAMIRKKLTQGDLAKRLGHNHRSYVCRLLGGERSMTIRTLSRVLAACGYEIRFKIVPIKTTT